MTFSPSSGPPTPASINFTDRNAVERFLETKKFRRCSNLKCDHVNLPEQVLYMPVCVERRFAREGVAQYFDLPLPGRPLSPVTYLAIPEWAPFISCPKDCKGYRNRTVAKVLAWFKWPRSDAGSLAGASRHWWNWDWKWWVATFIAVVAIVTALFQPEIRKRLGYDKPQPAVQTSTQSQPLPAPQATASVPEAKQTQSKEKPHHSRPTQTTPASTTTTTQITAPNGIAIGGNATVTNPTVNNFGAPEPNVTWSQEKGNVTEDKKATVVVTLKVDHSFEIPAFLALCDRPCETVGATPPGYSQTSFLNAKQNPNVAGFVFKAPRPLGSGLPVEWIIKSEDAEPIEVKSVEKVPANKLPVELR